MKKLGQLQTVETPARNAVACSFYTRPPPYLSETMGGGPSIADEAEASIRYSNTRGHFIVDGCELLLTNWELTACRSLVDIPAHALPPHQDC